LPRIYAQARQPLSPSCARPGRWAGERIECRNDRLAKGAQQVRVWLEYPGLSLRDLAEKAGISTAMLSEIEHAKKEGSIRTLSALAGALGLDLDDLVP
jgi:transcriptional regulator with XRE-family HTH domain